MSGQRAPLCASPQGQRRCCMIVISRGHDYEDHGAILVSLVTDS